MSIFVIKAWKRRNGSYRIMMMVLSLRQDLALLAVVFKGVA